MTHVREEEEDLHDKRVVKSWEAAPEKMGLETSGEVDQ